MLVLSQGQKLLLIQVLLVALLVASVAIGYFTAVSAKTIWPATTATIGTVPVAFLAAAIPAYVSVRLSVWLERAWLRLP